MRGRTGPAVVAEISFLCLLAAGALLKAQSPSFQPSFQTTIVPTGCPPIYNYNEFAYIVNGDHVLDLAIACGQTPGQFSCSG